MMVHIVRCVCVRLCMTIIRTYLGILVFQPLVTMTTLQWQQDQSWLNFSGRWGLKMGACLRMLAKCKSKKVLLTLGGVRLAGGEGVRVCRLDDANSRPSSLVSPLPRRFTWGGEGETSELCCLCRRGWGAGLGLLSTSGRRLAGWVLQKGLLKPRIFNDDRQKCSTKTHRNPWSSRWLWRWRQPATIINNLTSTPSAAHIHYVLCALAFSRWRLAGWLAIAANATTGTDVIDCLSVFLARGVSN